MVVSTARGFGGFRTVYGYESSAAEHEDGQSLAVSDRKNASKEVNPQTPTSSGGPRKSVSELSLAMLSHVRESHQLLVGYINTTIPMFHQN